MTNIIVLIGAGSIGQAIARRVSAGKHILLADIRQQNADAAAKVLTDAGFEVSTATVDVSTRESVHALVQTATDVALYLNRDWKEPGGLDRNSAFMVRWRLRPTRRKHALEHHSGVRRRTW
jgi:NAD(P)-dependent dehydrogenase (short-subunit alcohol dehydrogenase family)